jgi:hypothetical protein
MEHFVLSHSKGVPVGRPAEGSVTLLAILVSAVAVVRMGKVCATICTLVASVCNTNVMPCPEYWSVILTVPNCTSLVPLYESHFLLEIELQQEGAARGVRNVSTIAGFPFERSVGGDGLAEFSVTKVTVSGMLSQYLWNLAALNWCSDALNNSNSIPQLVFYLIF